jgi:hypothetical protein
MAMSQAEPAHYDVSHTIKGGSAMAWFGKSKPSSAGNLFGAIDRGTAAEIAGALAQQDFTLIEMTNDEDGSKGAFTGEFEDYPVLVAFTSQDHAADFAGANEDLLDANGEMPAFVVRGKDLLRYLPDGMGVVFNPESAEEKVIPPQLVGQIKKLA